MILLKDRLDVHCLSLSSFQTLMGLRVTKGAWYMQTLGFIPRVWFKRVGKGVGSFTTIQVILMWEWHSSHFYLLKLYLIFRAFPASSWMPIVLCGTYCLLSCPVDLCESWTVRHFLILQANPVGYPCHIAGICVKPQVSSWIQIMKCLESKFCLLSSEEKEAKHFKIL